MGMKQRTGDNVCKGREVTKHSFFFHFTHIYFQLEQRKLLTKLTMHLNSLFFLLLIMLHLGTASFVAHLPLLFLPTEKS